MRNKTAQWWYSLYHQEVPRDNNRADQFLRLANKMRKVYGVSRLMEDSAQTAILLALIQTYSAQERSAFEFFKGGIGISLFVRNSPNALAYS